MKATWHEIDFELALEDVSAGNLKLPQSKFQTSGAVPIVDQGKALVAGFTDERSMICRAPLPVIVFGDHTRCLKFVDFSFVIGADGVKVLRPRNEADTKYLYHCLRAVEITDGGYSRHYKYLKRCKIKVPTSLVEQRRIADILDRAEVLRAKRRCTLARLDELTQAVFLDMVANSPTNDKRSCSKLSQVTKLFGGTTLPSGQPYSGQSGGYFLLKVSDMNLPGNEVRFVSCQEWSETAGSAAATVPAGTVVIPKRGGAIGTNKKRLTVRPSILDPNLMGIAPQGAVLAEFLFQWFLGLNLASLANGTSVPQINKQDLAPLLISIPPLPFQQEFARRVQAIDRLKAHHRQSLSEMDALFQSLQHRAFRGQL